jgi:hypothetical protein
MIASLLFVVFVISAVGIDQILPVVLIKEDLVAWGAM